MPDKNEIRRVLERMKDIIARRTSLLDQQQKHLDVMKADGILDAKHVAQAQLAIDMQRLRSEEMRLIILEKEIIHFGDPDAHDLG